MAPRRIVGAIVGAAAAWSAYQQLVRPWHERWGATDDEVDAPLPGHDLIEGPTHRCTRAVTIEAGPEEVWPWVAQIGADRGGFYSYEWLENVVGLGIHNAERIVPEWQHLALGDAVYAHSNGSAGWYVMEVSPPSALVLQIADFQTGRTLTQERPPYLEYVWSFAVVEGGAGTTRLVVRETFSAGHRVTRLVMVPVGRLSFVMTRPMLRGIKARAERTGLAERGDPL
jgi:hypothetical protein